MAVMKCLKRVPWFYIFLTIFPLLYLWRANAAEIEPSVILRPLLVTAAGSGLLYLLLALIFRQPLKTHWVGALALVLFFSYGHVYNVLRNSPALLALGHHRILAVIYLFLFGLGLWGILKNTRKLEPLERWMNIFSGLLILLSVAQLAFFYANRAFTTRQTRSYQMEPAVETARQDFPDIYFIVLDSYMRADVLEQEMGFDNSAFINQLEELGFYVASCSRSNYDYTRGSIASILNMDYLPALEARTGLTVEEDGFWTVIKNSEVLRLLEANGYTTVAFQSEYPWLELSDAAVFMRLEQPSVNSHYIFPFERLYIRTTAGILWDAMESKLGILPPPEQDDEISVPANIDSYLRYHIDLQLFTLEKLSELPSLPGPKFVYAHLVVPHPPHVFTPDGGLAFDLSYEDYTLPAGSEADRLGYLNSVQFINHRILPILQTIIDASSSAPIIILQGDHGYQGGSPGQYTILNAYYLPDGYENLYPSITPVNSFRIVMNDYFGTNYPLLPDASYDSNGPVPETFPGCIP